MALALTGRVLMRPRFLRSHYSLGFVLGLVSNYERELFTGKHFATNRVSDVMFKHHGFVGIPCFCTSVQPERISWGGSSQQVLFRKIETALSDHRIDEAWEAFNDFKNIYGFSVDSLVSKMIIELSYSNNNFWLQKACDLVFVILKEKPGALKTDILTKLSLALARAQMPIPASMILRLLLEKGTLLPIKVMLLVFMHMLKAECGACLASNFLVQLCDFFLPLGPNRVNHAEKAKPDTMIFNIVLNACVRFELSIKGQQLIELMSQLGVIADAHSIVLIARIHEMNGHRDEMKRLKTYVDRVPVPLVGHYRQFYDSMLSLEFKFDDIDTAAEHVLDMYRYRASLSTQKHMKDSQKLSLVSIGSKNIRNGSKIQIMPELLPKDSVLNVEGKREFVIFRDGKLVPSNKALAKLISGYRRHGKIGELSRLLISIENEHILYGECNICSDVIDACIRLGWLDTAHDILDDMESAGTTLGSTLYMSLLRAYYKADMLREANALVKQMGKVGLDVNSTDEILASTSDLAECLDREVSEEEKLACIKVYELNSSIYFFCKAKMIGDALKTYRRMQKMKTEPTIQTFASLLYGYSSLEMYRDITILWGDIKRYVKCGNLKASWDLYELLLLNFLRGGYFERAMEVINDMKGHCMLIDKGMYKSEFLKFHKDLYRSLRQSKARTEAQSKRLEYVRAFRKLVGLD
ncbi:hypothetical protein HS088_TW04G01318 [Tripterygium wilfordii]|uniref:At1g68980-like TPR repeats domain-containing protein n=1 Tax=Tripterygium wilfordii TaxID=458696 RepID=A0A7J7DSK7_TRIWF|nr:pentatricopeptide repeat-containing protein At4g17616 [Tripterygium wilfordii]XP_038699352.1 pentatricopeptide repeat-containing protein At4g17616 [Tripterygium wilfordii]XP_038699353.1 pentatricopeptide repeat-containing protein At4g17616 [Tripterygium wilfordii]XP_038699354.1 pentatricopeptide repeat-containing protein At4g17616 [Tripterygium wilfordii]KAF5749350.1 hypothetical protein HS088_TW04G01318 [Tripterygium wilfordii]